MNWLLVIKALAALAPLVMVAVRERRIRTAAQDEVLQGLAGLYRERTARAQEARNEEHDPRIPDPYDRANAVSVFDDGGKD